MTSSNTLLPHLEPEVWDPLVYFVKRGRRVGGTPTKWKDLHQGDLASLMRVNSAFNEIAGWHLYHSVVTDDLQLFAYGLSRIKLDHLGHIKRLFLEDRLWSIVHRDREEVDVFNKEQWAVRNVEQRSFAFPLLDHNFQQAARTIMLQQGTILQFFIHLGQGPDSPFRYLETVSIHSFSKLLFVWNRAECALFEIFFHRGSRMAMRASLDTSPKLKVVCRQLAWGTMTDGGLREPQAFVCECGYDYQGVPHRRRTTCWHTFRPESDSGLLIAYERNMCNVPYFARQPYAESGGEKVLELTDAFHVGAWLGRVAIAGMLRKLRHERSGLEGKWVWGHRYVASEYNNIPTDDKADNVKEYIAALGQVPSNLHMTKFQVPKDCESTKETSKDAIRLTIVNFNSTIPDIGDQDQATGGLIAPKATNQEDRQTVWDRKKSRMSLEEQVVMRIRLCRGILERRKDVKDILTALDGKQDNVEMKSFLENGDCEACGGPGDVDKWMETIGGDMELDRKTRATLSRSSDEEEDNDK